MKILELKNLSFSYEKDRNIFSNINTQIESGDFIWVFWENGKWKTTLIKLILSLLKANFWEVIWYDSAWNKSKKNPYTVEYISQKAHVIDGIIPITVKELVHIGTYNKKKSLFPLKKENKFCSYDSIEKALKHVNMWDFLHTPFRDLSGWQQQRVLIAKSLLANPDIIIMDEPSAGIDSVNQKHFFDLLHHLNKKHNITIILISHNLQNLSDKIERVWYVGKTECQDCVHINTHFFEIKKVFQKQKLEFFN